MRIADKPNTVEITKRFLQLADEVIRDGLAKNRVEFCKSIGEYQQNFARFEALERAPTLEQLALCCKVYGYNPTWLILGAGEKKMKASEQRTLEQRVSALEVELAGLKRVIHKNGR
jgi:hypothetical protein